MIGLSGTSMLHMKFLSHRTSLITVASLLINTRLCAQVLVVSQKLFSSILDGVQQLGVLAKHDT
jgi:hypothetical protein